MSRPNWEASVEKARLASLKTFEGRLETARASFEQIPPNGKGASRGYTLVDFANQAGLEYKTLLEYRSVAEWWGDSRPQPTISWSTTREAMKCGKWNSGEDFIAFTLRENPDAEVFGEDANWTVDALRWYLDRPMTNTGKVAREAAAKGKEPTANALHTAKAVDAAHEAGEEILQVRGKLPQAEAALAARSEIPLPPAGDFEKETDLGFFPNLHEERRKLLAKLAEIKDWLSVNGAVVVPDPDGGESLTAAEILHDALVADKGEIDRAFSEVGVGTSIEEGFGDLLKTS